MIFGELAADWFTDSPPGAEFPSNVETLRSGRGGGMGECGDEIRKDALAGEYTSEICSSTNDVGISAAMMLVAHSKWRFTTLLGLDSGSSSYFLRTLRLEFFLKSNYIISDY